MGTLGYTAYEIDQGLPMTLCLLVVAGHSREPHATHSHRILWGVSVGKGGRVTVPPEGVENASNIHIIHLMALRRRQINTKASHK